MLEMEWILALACISFAMVALAFQCAISWGGGRKDYSVRAGSPARGVLYNFTSAMKPSHKETARLHLFKFAVGVAMHLGILAAIAKLVFLIVNPSFEPWRSVVLGSAFFVAALCGLYLFARRLLTAQLRSISSFDDYFSVLMVVGFLVFAALEELGGVGRPSFYVASAALFFYLPLGKLRHALFFFIARMDYGRRLGHRGVYPPKCGKVPPNA
jgi:uncharacterized membrane protein